MDSKWIPNGFPIEGNGIEPKGIEFNGVEDEALESNEETDSTDLSTELSTTQLEYSKGTLGEGIVLMSDAQFDSLCEKLTLDEIHHYFDRLKTFIRKNPQATIYSHYKTILKWVEEDRSV